MEGKDYVMPDSDVAEFHFNVQSGAFGGTRAAQDGSHC